MLNRLIENIMKKILFIFLGTTLLSLSSCYKIDNWDEPGSTFYGTVIDSYTGEPLLSSQNDWQFRIWERSWSGQPGGATNHQELRIMQDGTFQNTKLFDGTYDILPYNGPFWPVDTVKNVVLSGSSKQDFTVTPYLQIVDVSIDMFSYNSAKEPYDTLQFKFKVKAPLLAKDGVNLPNLYDVRMWISLTPWCGEGSNSFLNFQEYRDAKPNSTNVGKYEVRQSWTDVIKPANGGNGVDTSREFVMRLEVMPGYTYYVRCGACVNDTHRKFNYSPIQEIVSPKR
jgi:hypothetical protein